MSDAAAPLVHAVDVSCVFGRGERAVGAVREVSVSVRAGLQVALRGPSGSGKSTLLHVVAGLLKPSSGSLSWPGLGGPPAGRPGVVGVVFQGPSLVPALDVAENVALPLVLAGVPSPTAVPRAHDALDRLGVGDLAAKLPGELSGGQAQRVAVARVLAARPRLILADEPTGRLDHQTAAHVMDVLMDTAGELGAGLIVSTHDEQVAQRLPVRWQMVDGHLESGDGGVPSRHVPVVASTDGHP